MNFLKLIDKAVIPGAGSGIDCIIRELVKTVAKVVGRNRKIDYDDTRPDGALSKFMEVTPFGALKVES